MAKRHCRLSAQYRYEHYDPQALYRKLATDDRSRSTRARSVVLATRREANPRLQRRSARKAVIADVPLIIALPSTASSSYSTAA
jgi:hypothetical protein